MICLIFFIQKGTKPFNISLFIALHITMIDKKNLLADFLKMFCAFSAELGLPFHQSRAVWAAGNKLKFALKKVV